MLRPVRQGMRSHKYILVLGEGGTFALYQGLYPPKAFETAPTRDSMLTAGHKMALRAPQKLRWVLLAWVSAFVCVVFWTSRSLTISIPAVVVRNGSHDGGRCVHLCCLGNERCWWNW